MTQAGRPYFAYGSNMSGEQMAARCPEASVVDVARLVGHRFLINARGYATVVPDPADDVHGVLWRLGPDDETALDRYEGVGAGLYRKVVARVYVGRQTQHAVEALLYIAADETPGRPRAGYLERVVAGAEAHGLPADYVARLRAWLPPRTPRDTS